MFKTFLKGILALIFSVRLIIDFGILLPVHFSISQNISKIGPRSVYRKLTDGIHGRDNLLYQRWVRKSFLALASGSISPALWIKSRVPSLNCSASTIFQSQALKASWLAASAQINSLRKTILALQLWSILSNPSPANGTAMVWGSSLLRCSARSQSARP